MKRNLGFTLIELLIVIAIIAILALIAVPNFLEAQTRAKFSRSLADMKALCTAVDTLNMDTGYFPLDGWDDDNADCRNRVLVGQFNGVGNFSEAERSTTHYLAVLTSPVSYMTSIPIDPFLPQNTDPRSRGYGSPYTTYIYTDWDPNCSEPNNMRQGIQALRPDSMNDTSDRNQWGIKPIRLGEYGLVGIGPDGRAGIGTGNVGGDRGIAYSPTNGTVSPGDVVMMSGGRVNFD